MSDAARQSSGTFELDPAARLEQMWKQGPPPDLAAFLATCGPLKPAELAVLVRIDQRHRWRAGEPVTVETYLRCHPDIANDAEAAVDLIYGEYLLREQHGESPSADEYAARFPQFAASLRQQIELHRALGEEPTLAGSRTPGTSTDAADRTLPNAGELIHGHIPKTFGRYRILSLIGRGGMGAVYRARDTALGREIALKVILAAANDDVAGQRFAREARAAAGLSHANLCPVYDVGTIDGVPYLTMPLVAGQTLAARLRDGGALPEETATRLSIQIARAMQFAHEAGVIHRDLKPSNVIITESGEPVIIDFGLAALAHEAARLTPSGGLLGTPAYLPPEVVGGKASEVGPPADVYSLGVILYEMLTGRAPFEGSLFETIQKIKDETPAPPSRLRPGLSPRVERICLKAMAKNPAERFASMTEFADALAGLDGSAIGPPRARRKRLLLVALAALAAATLALLIFRPWSRPTGGDASFPPPAASSDSLQAGTRWTGRFKFREPIQDYAGDVELLITERTGDTFKGEYATESDKWRWAIAGRVDGPTIRWEFTAKIKEPEPRPVVGRARVEGTLRGDEIKAVFAIPDTNSTADVELRLRQ